MQFICIALENQSVSHRLQWDRKLANLAYQLILDENQSNDLKSAASYCLPSDEYTMWLVIRCPPLLGMHLYIQSTSFSRQNQESLCRTWVDKTPSHVRLRQPLFPWKKLLFLYDIFPYLNIPFRIVIVMWYSMRLQIQVYELYLTRNIDTCYLSKFNSRAN